MTAEIYDLPQEHKDFRDTIRQIAAEQIAPRAAEIDRTDEYPWDIRKLLGEEAPDVPGVLVLAVDLRGARRDPVLGELPDRRAKLLVLVREVVDVRHLRRGSVLATSFAMRR